MSQLHEKVRSLDRTNHELVKDVIAQFFVKLSRPNITDHKNWLESIDSILTRFPKYCLAHRNTIENYLVQFLDSERQAIVVGAAKCCHSIQQVRPVSEKTANAKSSWRQQMSLLCSTAHTVMAAAFADAVDIFKASGYSQSKESSENLPNTPMSIALSNLVSTQLGTENGVEAYSTLSPAQKSSVLCKRLKNVFIFIQAMLVEIYPVAKPVRPQVILDVIVRALSITSGSSADSMKETDRLTIDANAAAVKVEALRTLDALILCLGSNFIPYSPLVFRVATQTLRWGADNNNKQSTRVLKACHSTLKLWLTALRCHKLEGHTGRAGTSLEEELLEALLFHVAPKLNVVQLTMSNQSMKNLSKKARRKMATTILNQSAIAGHIPGEKNKQYVDTDEDPSIVISALECLGVLLTTCGIFLKITTHKKIQDCLIRAALKLDVSCDARLGLALCQALESCRVCVPSDIAPPTQYCLTIYSRLANSPHPQISQLCSQALLAVRASLHGAPPTLTFAALPQQREPEQAKPAAVVSERNRAALIALLGEDNVPPPPPPMEVGEIITLNDSPNRKRKAEDDKISVSSQSSIEVQIDESNGVDLQSTDTDFEAEPVDETDFFPKPSISNGKMRLLDFDKKADDSIYNLATQIPQVSSADNIRIIDDDSNHSIEISYDHTGKKDDEIKYLDKIDGDNLPSTGETDDIQITCGQAIRSSQDSVKSSGEKKMVKGNDILPVMNKECTTPVEVSSEVVDITDEGNKNDDDKVVEDKTMKAIAVADSTDNDGATNVEEMLADFVDEKA